jgi:uncharacterized tellurite resistance protein B-like protein
MNDQPLDRDRAVLVCRLIAGLVVTDDDLAPQEDAFIDRLLARFHIPQEERALIFPIIDAIEAAAKMRELPVDVREMAVDLLLQAAAVDGKIAPEERSYLIAVADAVGMPHDELDARQAKALATRA